MRGRWWILSISKRKRSLAVAPRTRRRSDERVFGRYAGWTLGQIKRADPEFLEWLMRVPAGRTLKREIGQLLANR